MRAKVVDVTEEKAYIFFEAHIGEASIPLFVAPPNRHNIDVQSLFLDHSFK